MADIFCEHKYFRKVACIGGYDFPPDFPENAKMVAFGGWRGWNLPLGDDGSCDRK